MAAFDLDAYFDRELTEHDEVFQATRRAVREPLARLVALSTEAVRGGGKLIFFGNGGSAADAQHLATELTVRFGADREPIAAIALTTDGSALTAIGNDLGFDELFARQIRAVGRAPDVAIGISTSGRSRNVLLGLEAARGMGLSAAGLTGGAGGGIGGGTGGDMGLVADPLIVVPSVTTARIQEMHITIGQMLCGALERTLGLVP